MTKFMTYLVIGEQQLKTKFLHEINETTWDTLINWFFKYKTNNIFAAAFLQLIEALFEHADSSILMDLILRLGFIQRIIECASEIYPNEMLNVANGGAMVAGILRKLLNLIFKKAEVSIFSFISTKFKGI